MEQMMEEGRMAGRAKSLPDHELNERKLDREKYFEITNWSFHHAHTGYPKLARFMVDGYGQSIFRKFSYLSTRGLVYMQNELQVLERELFYMDKAEHALNPSTLQSKADSDSASPGRKALMETIQTKWMQYAEMLDKAARVGNMPEPPERDTSLLQNKMYGGRGPAQIVNEDLWLHDREDLIGLFSSQALLEKYMQYAINLTGHPGMIMFDRKKLHRVSQGIMITCIVGLLVAPLYPMQALANDGGIDMRRMGAMIGVTILCTAVFALVLVLCTSAKPHEIYMASVGYMAVLVVFMEQS
ncbi:hypothetical protein S40288_04206 [Stachybotrys chartarum IBT 40288]|nr:hypothetical protein S40288_04206 [Stachybotrys chartarum IBT 40288]